MATIRREKPGDEAAIHAVHAACFPTMAEARLVGLLRDAGRLVASLVAESDGEIVGHLAVSPVTVQAGATGAGLAPLAVLPSHRRRGIAAELVRAGLDQCRNSVFTWAVVLGEPEYYARFGFRSAAQFGLSDEYGAGDAFQALGLVQEHAAGGGIPMGAGLVKYAPEFASLDES